MNAETVDGLTRSFTRQQRREINPVLDSLMQTIGKRINAEAPRIMALDKRPPAQANEFLQVFFPYVAQGMLEDLIAVLQAHV